MAQGAGGRQSKKLQALQSRLISRNAVRSLGSGSAMLGRHFLAVLPCESLGQWDSLCGTVNAVGVSCFGVRRWEPATRSKR